MTNLLALAFHYAAMGYSVVPVAADGTKRPGVPWKEYTERQPTADELVSWFAGDRFDGLGLICGAISGNLTMLELEGRAVREEMVPAVADALETHGLADLWATLQGYVEHTPSGGMHWYYRISDGPALGNTKIARRKVGDTRVDVLIETRGEGGFTVIAPSAGRSHPSGKGWTVYTGAPEHIPTITSAEQEALFGVLSAIFDEMPKPQAPAPSNLGSPNIDPLVGLRPGDDYNAKATWESILEPRGWTKLFAFDDGGHAWCRPGKRYGISASTGRNDGDNLYVFSTSTEFDTEVAYSKFHAYTLLHHNGDFSAAASALRAQGFGSEPKVEAPRPHLSAVPDLPTDGSAALAPQPNMSHPYSDDGNALALVERYGDVIRHCGEKGNWYAWNGYVWESCPGNAGPVAELAKDVARNLPTHSEPAKKWRQKSLNASGTRGMLSQASTDSRVVVHVDDLDSNAWELNTPTGIADLKTGRLSPPDSGRLHTRTTKVTPDWQADRTVWDQFLAVTFNHDAEFIGYLQRLVGYSAVGEVGVHIMPYCYGSGGNGKGVFLETIAAVLGDYATSAPPGFLMAQKFDKHETEIARLAGARFVLCSEVNEAERFDEAKVKLLTGGDTLTARFMRADHVSFKPTHTLWAMGNHLPNVPSGGDSFWRRLRTIPFVHTVPPEQRIDDLQGILAREHGPAILSWIIDGAAAYAQHGLGVEPEIVKVATDEYAHEQDTVARFLEEACLLGGGDAVCLKTGIVRTAYEKWCRENGDEPVSVKALATSLKRAGVGSKRTASARMYTNISLLASTETVSDQPAEEWWKK